MQNVVSGQNITNVDIEALLDCVRAGSIAPSTALRLLTLDGVELPRAEHLVAEAQSVAEGRNVWPFPAPMPLECA